MKNSMIFVFVLIAIIFFIYFNYTQNERPKQQDAIPQFVNLSIVAENTEDQRIQTGYKIFYYGVLKSDKNTSTRGFVHDKTLFNESFSIFNYNLPNQNYYTDEVSEIITTPNNKRIEFNLIEGSLKITQSMEDDESKTTIPLSYQIWGEIDSRDYLRIVIFDGEVIRGQMQTGENIGIEDIEMDLEVDESLDTIYLILESSTEFRNTHFCIEYSTHFLKVESNFEQIEKPERFSQQYDKCYNTWVEVIK